MSLADEQVLSPREASPGFVGRLERLPLTGYQRGLFAVIASAWLVDQVDVALLTFLLGSIVSAFHRTPAEAGRLAAMTFEVGAGGFLVAALLVAVLGIETRGMVLEDVSA